jgi:hypothetical protein
MNTFDELPFPRGRTASDFLNGKSQTELDADTTWLAELEGRIYTVPDTVHGTGLPVKLRVVRNVGADYTVTDPVKLLKFDTAASSFGRKTSAVTSATGSVCKPIDDAYAAGAIIYTYDLFYVVEAGPCSIAITGTTTPTTGQSVMCHTDGTVSATKTTAGSYDLGVIDYTPNSEGEAIIHVNDGLRASQAGT